MVDHPTHLGAVAIGQSGSGTTSACLLAALQPMQGWC